MVWVAFAPLFLSLRYFQRKLSAAYGVVRRQMGAMLAAISEPVVGAAVVRSYAVEDRTQARIDEAIDEFKAASTTAQKFTVVSFSLGGISAGLANAGVIIIGIWLGFADDITAGTVLAFAFLVTLFVGPVQIGTQILTDAQNAIAGWRRVIGILETPGRPGRPRPRRRGAAARADRRAVRPRLVRLPRRPAGAAGHRPRHRGRPPGRGRRRDRLRQVDGRQAADPADGPGRGRGAARRRRRTPDRAGLAAPQRRAGAAGGVPLRRHHHRQRPLRQARRHRGRDPGQRRRARPRRLAGRRCPAGLDTQVGQRGESLSAGERQLVALLRAHLADPDLLVLDEATSAVDPQLEMRIGRALERLMSGRTSVTIAHRMSTAESADEVVVVDRGRIVQRGPHAELVAQPGSVYAGLHASWVAQQGRWTLRPARL